MKIINRTGKVFLILFGFLNLTVEETYSQSTAQDIYEKNSQAVVVVETYDKNGNPLSQGSGCQLNEEGLVVTNFHVMKGAFSANLIFSDNSEFKVNYVYAYDKQHDLAFLKHYGKRKDHVRLSSSDDVRVGDVCYTIGTPKGFQNTISNGLISNILKDESEYVFQISNAISPGSSGGGLFNDEGELIGITFATFLDGQNINFAMPSKYLSELLLKPFKQTTLSEFQVIIGSSAVLYPKKEEHVEREEPVPETEIEELEVEDEKSFDFETGFSYDIGGRYIFMSSLLGKDVPSFVEFRKGFSATFSYWYSSYGGLGLTYQKQDVVNKSNGKKINLRLYKGEFLIRTSEHPIRVIMGLGIGLANSEFQKGEDDSGIMVGESSNQFSASANFGIEFMIMNRFSISASSPVDYILVSDSKSLGVFFISPSVGLNVVF